MNKVKIYGPCSVCGHDKEDELNFESLIHHNGNVRCIKLKDCKRRSKKKKNKRKEINGNHI
jgi:hypothetical protein